MSDHEHIEPSTDIPAPQTAPSSSKRKWKRPIPLLLLVLCIAATSAAVFSYTRTLGADSARTSGHDTYGVAEGESCGGGDCGAGSCSAGMMATAAPLVREAGDPEAATHVIVLVDPADQDPASLDTTFVALSELAEEHSGDLRVSAIPHLHPDAAKYAVSGPAVLISSAGGPGPAEACADEAEACADQPKTCAVKVEASYEVLHEGAIGTEEGPTAEDITAAVLTRLGEPEVVESPQEDADSSDTVASVGT